MARPLAPAKRSVDLAGGPRKVGSRIRRAPPPPPPKTLSATELREREKWVVILGIIAFGLALTVLLFSAGKLSAWSPSEKRIVIERDA